MQSLMCAQLSISWLQQLSIIFDLIQRKRLLITRFQVLFGCFIETTARMKNGFGCPADV